MTLNSLDVQNKTFNPQWRGFNKHEVDEFLDIVVRDYDDFAQTLKDQERELKSLRERVKYFDEMKDSLNKSIVVAQDAADNLRAQAQKEADGMIGEAATRSQMTVAEASTKSQAIIDAAKKEASYILNSAADDARELVRNTDDLKRQMRIYHQRMSSMIETQMASISSDEWEEVIKPTSNDYLINPEEKLQEIIEATNQETVEIKTPLETEPKAAIGDDEAEITSEIQATSNEMENPVDGEEQKLENEAPSVDTPEDVENETLEADVAPAIETPEVIYPELEENPGSVENTVNEALEKTQDHETQN